MMLRMMGQVKQKLWGLGGVHHLLGATEDEARMPLPGDDLVASPQLQTTHAIDVDARAEAIWPWLVQIGQGRAGFYSDSPLWDACVDLYYRVLSHEQGAKGVRYQHDDACIAPDWQDLRAGDVIPDGPPGTAFYVVREMVANHALVLFTTTHLPYMVPRALRGSVAGELSDAFVLLPLRTGATRVLRRMRVACRPLAFQVFALPIVATWGEMITARRFLRGLKRRVESCEDAARKRRGTSHTSAQHLKPC